MAYSLITEELIKRLIIDFEDIMATNYPKIQGDEAFKPKDFYKELAEYGLLDEFVQDRMKNRFQTSDEFKTEVVKALVNYSSKPIPAVDLIFLEKLKEHLKNFLERANQCTNQKP